MVKAETSCVQIETPNFPRLGANIAQQSKQVNLESLQFIQIIPSDQITEKLYYMQENACFQLCVPIGHENKEQMTSLMELADGIGAKRLFACVEKSSVYFKQIAQSLASIGFSITEPLIGLTGFAWFLFEL